MSTSLKTLITKLNASARMATQRAANLCLANGHYEVDLEHLFLALLAGVTCEYEVRLILAREEVAAVQLSDGGGSHLGWDSFIATGEAESDRSDTQYELQPLQ